VGVFVSKMGCAAIQLGNIFRENYGNMFFFGELLPLCICLKKWWERTINHGIFSLSCRIFCWATVWPSGVSQASSEGLSPGRKWWISPPEWRYGCVGK
jgi:hypothetical protein